MPSFIHCEEYNVYVLPTNSAPYIWWLLNPTARRWCCAEQRSKHIFPLPTSSSPVSFASNTNAANKMWSLFSFTEKTLDATWRPIKVRDKFKLMGVGNQMTASAFTLPGVTAGRHSSCSALKVGSEQQIFTCCCNTYWYLARDIFLSFLYFPSNACRIKVSMPARRSDSSSFSLEAWKCSFHSTANAYFRWPRS